MCPSRESVIWLSNLAMEPQFHAESSLFPECSHNGWRCGTNVFMIDETLDMLSPICSCAQEVFEPESSIARVVSAVNWLAKPREGFVDVRCNNDRLLSHCVVLSDCEDRLQRASTHSRARSTMRDSLFKSQVETLSTHTLPAIWHHVQVTRTTSTVFRTIGKLLVAGTPGTVFPTTLHRNSK